MGSGNEERRGSAGTRPAARRISRIPGGGTAIHGVSEIWRQRIMTSQPTAAPSWMTSTIIMTSSLITSFITSLTLGLVLA